jgi:hypothetical protein
MTNFPPPKHDITFWAPEQNVPEMAKVRTMESPTALPFRRSIIYGIFQSGDALGFNSTENGHSWVCTNANSW